MTKKQRIQIANSIPSNIKFGKLLMVFSLLGILIVGGFFRFYKIREYLTFLGDEGRDMLVVKRMIVDHKMTLLGPITSVGSMYMGPVYYYMMAPFLWLWHLDPVGPSVMVAILSLATIVLIFLTGRQFLNTRTGLIAAILYAFSPLTILYGRSSWNPNVVPFFSTLLVWSLLKVIVKDKKKWLMVAGFSMGILLQLHYVTFMFLLIIPFMFFYFKPKVGVRWIIASIVALIIAYSPFLLFEVRHGFVNTQSVIKFVFTQKRVHEFFLTSFFSTTTDVGIRIFWRLVVVSSAEASKLLMMVLAVFYFRMFRSESAKGPYFQSARLIMIWLILGILSFGLYRGVIYDYYFGSLFAAPFLLTAIFLDKLFDHGVTFKAISAGIILFLLVSSLNLSPLKIQPNNMLKNTEEIARSIYSRTDGKPYNFALIALMNSDQAYRYFLEIWGNPPVVIQNPQEDPKRTSVTGQLFVVCEEKICQPEGHPLWEIAGFGRAEIIDQWNPVTVKAYRLIHYNENNKPINR